ncbi:MAG: hypothetical protein F4007_02395, partial [Chloroflexi bacterium]|nr:hypothetical protein [Chloroflexota bacterium]
MVSSTSQGAINRRLSRVKGKHDVVTETATEAHLSELQLALTALPRQRTQVLPALHIVDEVYGYLDHQAL